MYIFHISDLHFDNSDKAVWRLRRLIDNIRKQDVSPDMLLITGDITHQSDYASYGIVFEELKKLETPIFCITGNNDSSAGIIKALREYLPKHPRPDMPNALQYVADEYPFRIIALDSFAPSVLSGNMDEERLTWLKNKLEDNPDKKPVLVMVHQFTPENALHRGHAPWFDSFNKLIAEHNDTVRLVVSGHLHASLSAELSGVRFISCFSANWNSILDFRNHGNQIRDDSLPAGYLIHNYNDGNFVSYSVIIA